MPRAAPAEIDPHTDAHAARLRFVIGRLDRQLRQQTDTTLSPTMLSIFGSIHLLGPISLGELAAHERLSAPTISKAATELEQQGMIERIRDADDRRVWRVQVTRKGERWSLALRAQRNAWLAQRIGRLDPDDRAALLAAVPVLERILDLDD